jgi:hypothetical protein
MATTVKIEFDITFAESIWGAAKAGLDKSSNEVLTISRDRYCPVDTGKLKASAKDEVIENTEDTYTREISYSTDYVFYVHEIPYQHLNPPTATWKFLETPFERHEQKFSESIENAVRDVL